MELLITSCERYPSDYSLAVVMPRLDYLYCGERRFYIHYEIRADAQSEALYSSCTPLVGSMQNYIVPNKEWQFAYAFGNDGSWRFKAPKPLASSCCEDQLLSDAKERLAERCLPPAAPDYLSTAQMPFTSAVGPARSAFFQSAIDAFEMGDDALQMGKQSRLSIPRASHTSLGARSPP